MNVSLPIFEQRRKSAGNEKSIFLELRTIVDDNSYMTDSFKNVGPACGFEFFKQLVFRSLGGYCLIACVDRWLGSFRISGLFAGWHIVDCTSLSALNQFLVDRYVVFLGLV